MGFFLEGEYSHGDHGLGSLVELVTGVGVSLVKNFKVSLKIRDTYFSVKVYNCSV
jgi:hypothetical protein